MASTPTASREDAVCRVCGLAQSEPPWGEDDRVPIFDICDCCGTEFGYEDCTIDSVKAARARWLANRMPWFSPALRPADWDVDKQLLSVPSKYR